MAKGEHVRCRRRPCKLFRQLTFLLTFVTSISTNVCVQAGMPCQCGAYWFSLPRRYCWVHSRVNHSNVCIISVALLRSLRYLRHCSTGYCSTDYRSCRLRWLALPGFCRVFCRVKPLPFQRSAGLPGFSGYVGGSAIQNPKSQIQSPSVWLIPSETPRFGFD
jgi:hypothetical protein